MVLAAYVATAFLVAGIHAFFLLRDPQSVFHRAPCSIALVVACVSIPLQILSGDFAAREVAKLEPPYGFPTLQIERLWWSAEFFDEQLCSRC